MKAKATSLAVGLVLAMSVACGEPGEPDPPSFVGLEIWEGYLADVGSSVLGRRVDPEPDGGFALRRETLHLARVTVRTSGRADRCLFRPFFYSWAVLNRSYDCYPEVQDGPMTIDVPFSTWTTDIQRVSDHHVLVQLYELGPQQTFIAIWDTRRYPVRFVD